jgi:adenosylcobinamide kinase/adenosylcobinamide-phosphate guanylyltransferase
LGDHAAFTLVLGGASSGKSACAERICRATGKAPVYVATAQAFDDEMRAKIDRHRRLRGDGWTTIEAPLDLAGALAAAPAEAAVLVDCASLWLTNLLLSGADPDAARAALLAALRAAPQPVTVVSNETGLGIVPENALARRFRDAQGRLNQALAAEAGAVVAVMAGLPLALKGGLPPGAAP